MSSNQQALLMVGEDGEAPPPAPVTCVADPYYSCGPAGDPYWANVVLMLHMDGTDGATTFTDSSSYARSMTASGDAQIFTESPKFGTGAGLFDGTGDSVTANAVSTDFDLGDGDFTIEAWVKPAEDGRLMAIVNNRPVSPDRGFYFSRSATNKISVNGWDSTGSAFASVVGTTTVPSGVWTHLAWTRSGTAFRVFVNGIQDGTATSSTAFGVSTQPVLLAHDLAVALRLWNGQIDDIRITKGVARYTGNFNIPTAAFPDALETVWDPADPRTVLSLHAEDTSDASCYQPKTVTLTGSASVSTTEKKFDTASFLVPNAGTSTLNGVVINDHMDLDFGTDDFTIEMWAYRSTNDYAGTLFYFTEAAAFSLVVAATTGLVTLNYRSSGGTQADIATGVVFPLTEWQHVVVQRRGTNFEFFLHGVLGNTVAITGGASSTVNSAGAFYLGRTNAASASSWNGYIDEARVTKGVARYLSDFTVVDADSTDPLWDETIFLMNAEDGILADSSQYGLDCLSNSGGAVSSAEQVFGANSYYFDTLGDYISGPGDVALIGQLGSNEFCIDWWMKPVSNDAGNDGTLFWIGSINAKWRTEGLVSIIYVIGGSSTSETTAAGTVPVGEWAHIAFGRKNVLGSSPYFYVAVNGVVVVWRRSASSGDIGTSGFNRIGGLISGNSSIWYLDNFRVTISSPPRFLESFDPATLPNCDSTTAGEGRTVDGSSPLTGQSVTVNQQAFVNGDSYVKLENTRLVYSPDGSSVVFQTCRMDTYTGHVSVSSVAKDPTVSLTGVSASVSVSAVPLSIPSYPGFTSFTKAGMTNTVVGGQEGNVFLRIFANGTVTVTDQTGAVLYSATWIDTTQTNYTISSIANQYRVVAVTVFTGSTLLTSTTVPSTLDSTFEVVAANLYLDGVAGYSPVMAYDVQVSIAPTTLNPRYGEVGYTGTVRISGNVISQA